MKPSAPHLRLLSAAIIAPLVLWNVALLVRCAIGQFPGPGVQEYGTGAVVSAIAGILIVWPIALVFRHFGWTKLGPSLLLGLVSGWVYEFASEAYIRLLARGFHHTDHVHSMLGVLLYLFSCCFYLFGGALFFLIAYHHRSRNAGSKAN